MKGETVRKIFPQELAELGDDIASMAEKVAEAVKVAGAAFRDADVEGAEQVIDADNRIDELEEGVERLCLSVLSRQAPVATDLRLVVSAMRLSATLERMGDLARHIAFIAREAFPNQPASGPMADLFVEMSSEAESITAKLAVLMDTHDLELAEEIISDDDRLDAALDRSFELLADPNVDMPRQQVVDAVLAARFFERIGDHAVSGAKRISYLVTGDLDASASFGADSPGETPIN